mgnify:CR=1 FL=1|jgi:hypothetical protein
MLALRFTLIIASFLTITSSTYAANFRFKEYNQSFNEWLVSCKVDTKSNNKDCFIGTPIQNDKSKGALVYTKQYMAISHEDLSLKSEITLQIDNNKAFHSYLATGSSLFFKKKDRHELTKQMTLGKNIKIKLSHNNIITKSLKGFRDSLIYFEEQFTADHDN